MTLALTVLGMSMTMTSSSNKVLLRLFGIDPSQFFVLDTMINFIIILTAFPAMLLIRSFGFRAGLLMGTSLFAAGTFAYLPASQLESYAAFMTAIVVMALGVSFLEVTTMPYMLSTSSERHAASNLLISHSFINVGAVAGYFAMQHAEHIAEAEHPQAAKETIAGIAHSSDLMEFSLPYAALGTIAALLAITLVAVELRDSSVALRDKTLPADLDDRRLRPLGKIVKDLVHDRRYMGGLLAMLFYTCAQGLCWSTVVSYGIDVVMQNEGLSRVKAAESAEMFWIIAMVIFAIGRFIAGAVTRIKEINIDKMLLGGSLASIVMTLLAMALSNLPGLYCMVCISLCMSSMRPNIFYTSARHLDPERMKTASLGHELTLLGSMAAAYIGIDDSSPKVKLAIALVSFCFLFFYALTNIRRDKAKAAEESLSEQ